MNIFNKLIKYIKILLVVGFIIVEEIVWNKVGRPAYLKVKSLKIMERFKTWVSEVKHRYQVLMIFLVPFVLMEISSIYALKLIALGSIFTGIGLYTFKILLTAPVVIIFNAAKPQLISFFIIRYSYGMILRFKRSRTFRRVKQYTKQLKIEMKKFKEEYLNGDTSFSDEMKRIYKDLKNI